jgi:hypothetical protein
MAKSIDLKSLLMGGLLALLVVCILGAAPRLMPPDPVGRFAIVPSHFSTGAYVLDTMTGQVWPEWRAGRESDAFWAPKLKTRESQTPGRSDPQ